jgi:hypothetical protein
VGAGCTLPGYVSWQAVCGGPRAGKTCGSYNNSNSSSKVASSGTLTVDKKKMRRTDGCSNNRDVGVVTKSHSHDHGWLVLLAETLRQR